MAFATSGDWFCVGICAGMGLVLLMQRLGMMWRPPKSERFTTPPKPHTADPDGATPSRTQTNGAPKRPDDSDPDGLPAKHHWQHRAHSCYRVAKKIISSPFTFGQAVLEPIVQPIYQAATVMVQGMKDALKHRFFTTSAGKPAFFDDFVKGPDKIDDRNRQRYGDDRDRGPIGPFCKDATDTAKKGPVVTLEDDVTRTTKMGAITNAAYHNVNTDKPHLKWLMPFPSTITGLGEREIGSVYTVTNEGMLDVTFTHQDTRSRATNRFRLPGGKDLTLHPGGSQKFIYGNDIATAADPRWLKFDPPQTLNDLF